MALVLNLAALTDEELHTLLGDEGALTRLPEVSRARLEGRPVVGGEVAEQRDFRPLAERPWGSTPEQARTLSALLGGLEAAQARPVGGPCAEEPGHDLVMPFVVGSDTAVLLRWNESGAAPLRAPAHLDVLTWLRDGASGLSCVLSTGSPVQGVPAPSEEVDLHWHPELGVAELLGAHAGHVMRQGRTRKLPPDAHWAQPWQDYHRLNLDAWRRRGVVLGEPAARTPV